MKFAKGSPHGRTSKTTPTMIAVKTMAPAASARMIRTRSGQVRRGGAKLADVSTRYGTTPRRFRNMGQTVAQNQNIEKGDPRWV